MHITDLVSEDRVIPALSEQTKDGVLRELVDPLAAEHPGIDTDQLLAMLWERERLGSTGIAEGVAIPHAKLPGLPKVIGVVGRHRQGIDFASLDGTPTKLFFLLVTPAEAAAQHLKALAQVSRLVKDAVFRERLMTATDRHELYLQITSHDGQS
ncbi:MAG: putative IIA-like nitrogen-regulatory protein PtsN [Deltaproteobacteria bacterium]|nr:putative IIA-like nitrogen-regulatory protein PtsN [Deltaproteobacteria bacterium]